MTCCPDDTYFTWQVHLWLDNLRTMGKSEDAVVLLFIPHKRNKNPKWVKIIDLFPETTFKFYRDDKNEISSGPISKYIPVLRPWLMMNWFIENPEFKDHAIFYCDSDILFSENFNVSDFVDDDNHYVSDTNSYISITYFDSKVKDVIESKLEEYKELDIFAMLGSLIGVTREMGEANKEHSGGAQYLMKNLNSKFWRKVMNDCLIIRNYLMKVNKDFFINESKGFQSWCADMWAVLWNLWLTGQETKVIPEMGFCWSTDQITKLDDYPILHNAGVTGKHMGKVPYFFKGAYHQGQDPMRDPHLETVLNHEISKTKCNWYYANALKQLKEKYNINY